jgi:transcriptional regulator with XRE-family HTH domain
MTIPELLRALMEDGSGLKQDALADILRVSQTTVSRWATGKQDPGGRHRDAIRQLAQERGLIAAIVHPQFRVVGLGFVSAGAQIVPEVSQVPEGGLFTVELMIPVSDDVVAYRVQGDAMFPRFHDGDLILVHKDERPVTSDLLNAEAIVRLKCGRRFLKTIRRGYDPEKYNLESWNAPLIEDADIEAASEVYLIVPARQVRLVRPPIGNIN